MAASAPHRAALATGYRIDWFAAGVWAIVLVTVAAFWIGLVSAVVQ